jgi:hypothetical protein
MSYKLLTLATMVIIASAISLNAAAPISMTGGFFPFFEKAHVVGMDGLALQLAAIKH